jgi:hypothetical protein
MKQIIQALKNGKTILKEFPIPEVKPGYLLNEAIMSLVSFGTERMLVDFDNSNLIQKLNNNLIKLKSY